MEYIYTDLLLSIFIARVILIFISPSRPGPRYLQFLSIADINHHDNR